MLATRTASTPRPRREQRVGLGVRTGRMCGIPAMAASCRENSTFSPGEPPVMPQEQGGSALHTECDIHGLAQKGLLNQLRLALTQHEVDVATPGPVRAFSSPSDEACHATASLRYGCDMGGGGCVALTHVVQCNAALT